MKTLDRYLCLHFLQSLLGVLFMAALVVLIAEIRDIYGEILTESPSPKWVLIYLALTTPGKLAEAIPLSTAVAALWTLMRLSRQNELLGTFCGGLSPMRLSAPFLGVAIALSVFLFVANEVFLHRMQEAAVFVYQSYIRGKSPGYLGRSSHVFQKGGGRTFYSMEEYRPESREMLQPVILTLGETDAFVRSRMEAVRAQHLPGARDQWRFFEPRVWRYDSTGRPLSFEENKQLDIALEPDIEALLARPRKPAEMNFFDLRYYVQTLRRQGYPAPDLQTELHLKIAFPLAPALMTLLVCSFALHPRAGKMFVQFSGGVAMAAAYYAATVMFRKFGHRDLMIPWVAAWLPNLLFLFLGGYFFLRQAKV